MFHTSHNLITLTNRPMFLSLTKEEAIAWEGMFIYEVILKAEGVQATTEEEMFLVCNPTEDEIKKTIKTPVVIFKDYDPRNFEKDGISILCLDPTESIASFTLMAW
jgi:hypothetical protein